MKPIHLILSIALLAGGACGDQQEPYYGNSEVKMPQIDSEWNLELMPRLESIRLQRLEIQCPFHSVVGLEWRRRCVHHWFA